MLGAFVLYVHCVARLYDRYCQSVYSCCKIELNCKVTVGFLFAEKSVILSFDLININGKERFRND